MTDLPWSDLSHTLWFEMAGQRSPFACEIEVSPRCNFRCKHCYLGDLRTAPYREMRTLEVKHLLDEMADQGVLWVQFTGGEPLLRRDVPELIEHSRMLGLVPILFTNGSTMTQELADELERARPHAIEITLYGASEETYSRMTGVHGAFGRVLDTIDLLVSRRFHLMLKTVVTTITAGELPAIKKVADDHGLPFRFDPEITPCVDGRTNPYELRLPVQEIVSLEGWSDKRSGMLRETYLRHKGMHPKGLFVCAAGLTTFHIDYEGYISPCGLFRTRETNAIDLGFGPAWAQIGHIREFPLPKNSECHRCEFISVCKLLSGLVPPRMRLDGCSRAVQVQSHSRTQGARVVLTRGGPFSKGA